MCAKNIQIEDNFKADDSRSPGVSGKVLKDDENEWTLYVVS